MQYLITVGGFTETHHVCLNISEPEEFCVETSGSLTLDVLKTLFCVKSELCFHCVGSLPVFWTQKVPVSSTWSWNVSLGVGLLWGGV